MSQLELSESFIDRQKNELAVLKSIFGDELQDLRKNKQKKKWQPLDILVTLTPQKGMSGPAQVYVQTDLRITCGEEYPEEVPRIQVQNSQGLSHEQIAILVSEVEELAQKLRGEVMIFELAQHVRKFLCKHNKPGFSSFYEEMILRKQEKIKYEMQERQMKEDKERQVLQDEIQKRQEALKAELRNRKETRRSLDSEPLSRSIPSSPRERVRTYSRRRCTSTSESSESNCEHRGTKLLHFDSNKSGRQVHRGKCFGHSTKGSVVFAGLDMVTGELLAVTEWTLKYISKESENGPENPNDLQHYMKQIATIEQELNHLCKLHHMNLVHYLNMKSMQDEDCIMIYILQEFVFGTTCSVFFTDNTPMGIDMLRHLANGILSALHYLHENNVVHKDIRDSSVYIDRSGVVRLSDYSLDKRLSDIYQASCLAKTEGDFPTIQGRSGKKLDIYRFGILLFSLIKGYIVSEKELELDSTLQANLKDFLSKCLVKDERSRWSTEQLLEHSFIRTPLDRGLSPPDEDRDKEEDDSDSEEPITAVRLYPPAFGGHSRIQNEFEVMKWLGKGAFGDVLKVKNKLDGCVYAIKRIKLNPKNKQLNRKITREVKLLSRLHHENVVRYYNSWIESATLDDRTLCLDSTSADTPNMPSEEENVEIADQLGSGEIEKLAPPIHDVEWNVSYESRVSAGLSANSEEDENDDSSDSDEDWAFMWLNGLFQAIKDDFHPFQTIIMLDGRADNLKESVVEKIIEKVISDTSSRVINFLQEKPQDFRSSVASRSIHETTLFLTIQTGKTNPRIPLDFLMEVSRTFTHPKCLMIILLDVEGGSREELLRFGWSKNFLDLTVLDLVKKTDAGRKLLWDPQNRMTVIHHFNPFNQTYTRKRYAKEESIFPYKLHDLKGFEMKVATIDIPPKVSVRRNLSGYPFEISGPDANIIKILSEAQNFRVSEVPFESELMGNYSCKKNETTGLVKQLAYNEIQFFTNNLGLISQCKDHLFTFVFITHRIRYVALIPILTSTTVSLSVNKTSFYVGLLTCLLIILIWLFLRLLRFNSRFWQLLHFVQMLLGIPVPRDIDQFSERIALAFILIGFWLFSSTFYSILTDIKITAKSEDLINSLADLQKSKLLTLMSHNLYYLMLTVERNEILQAILNKSDVFFKVDDCVKLLINSKNVSCILWESIAQLAVSEHLENGTPFMKVLPEVFVEAPEVIFFEPNSPYTPEFERKLGMLIQSGLITKWNQEFMPPVERNLEINLMGDMTGLLFHLLLILAAGYGIAIITLFGELLLNYIEKRIHCKISFW